ncbi:MAG TPA: DUF4340 domain-containing protein [Acidobacteriaceae bacterium]|nr:DUF4340 domain-containing protein [Acidobacteriaceae bacterium]
MNSRGLLVAVVVLAALTGVLYWSQHRKPPENTAVSANTAPSILKVNMPDVTELEIKNRGTEPVTLKKTGDKWEITEPKPYPADQDAVIGVLSSLSYLNTDRVVEDKAADRKQYGLDSPAAELEITQKGKGTQELLLGDDTPAGGDVYAGVAGDPRVFTIASYNKTSLDKSLNDLRDKSLISLNPDKVSRVDLVQKGKTIEFDRTKDGWQILKPSSSPADGNAVNDLVHSVTSARMDLTANDASADFAHGIPVASARLTGDTGTQTLDVRKDKNDYYAKSSLVDGVYKVDPSVGQALEKKLEDFQQKKPALASAAGKPAR